MRVERPEQIALCRAWLLRFGVQTKRIQRDEGTSYSLKHAVESWAGAYVEEGAFLEAAEALGFRLERIGAGQQSWLNIRVRAAGLRRGGGKP